eukprot:2101787-Rhodomonas_salina.1
MHWCPNLRRNRHDGRQIQVSGRHHHVSQCGAWVRLGMMEGAGRVQDDAGDTEDEEQEQEEREEVRDDRSALQQRLDRLPRRTQNQSLAGSKHAQAQSITKSVAEMERFADLQQPLDVPEDLRLSQ